MFLYEKVADKHGCLSTQRYECWSRFGSNCTVLWPPLLVILYCGSTFCNYFSVWGYIVPLLQREIALIMLQLVSVKLIIMLSAARPSNCTYLQPVTLHNSYVDLGQDKRVSSRLREDAKMYGGKRGTPSQKYRLHFIKSHQ